MNRRRWRAVLVASTMRVWLLLTALAVTAACGGDSPTAPSDSTAQLAGAWTGALSYTFEGTSYSHSVTGTVSQDRLNIKATLTLSSDWRATIDGTLTGQRAGAQLPARITFDTPSDHPPMRCAAAFNATSSPVVPTMMFQANTVTFTNCDSTITSVVLTLQR
jgi:hypothetical protein